jgi:AcrR family transcriptional regulator
LAEIGRFGAQVFIEKGYRLALMSDVAEAVGVSHGLLYRYVENKEALFGVAVRSLTRPESLSDLKLPVATPGTDETVALAVDWIREWARVPRLSQARKRDRAEDVRTEFTGIIDEHYAAVVAVSPVLALVERCASDLPELHAAWYGRARRSGQVQLSDYIRRRIEGGQMRAVPNVTVAARFVIETIAWFAWHRKGDPDSAMFDDDIAVATVRHLLIEAFCESGRTGPPTEEMT